MVFNAAISANIQVEVVLVDYGETITVSMNQLYPIQQRFCRDPAYGLLCCLDDLEPTNSEWKMNDDLFFFEQTKCRDFIATFHRPKDRKITPSFLSSDFYVSLKKKDCAEVREGSTKRRSAPESPSPPTRGRVHRSTNNTSEGRSFLRAISCLSPFSNHQVRLKLLILDT